MTWVRAIFENAGGRKFLHATYIDTLVLVAYALLRATDHLGPEHWEPTMGALWKITGAYLAAHGAAEVAGAIAKGKGGIS